MNTAYKFKIENPCHKKNWSLMTFSDKGKFCSICTKNVYDFAVLIDEEIIKLLNTSNEPICGKLNYSQLHRVVSINQKSDIKYWNTIVTSLLVLISSSTIYANEKNLVSTNQYQSKTKFSEEIKKLVIIPNDSIKSKIAGVLIEKGSKKPIPNITLGIKGTVMKTVTDSFGNFEFLIPDNFPSNDITIMLIAEHGFEGKTEITVFKNELPIKNLAIEKPDIIIGEVTFYKAKKWWQFWKRR